MNTIDFIICLVLALAVWNGWRQGFVMQVCSLAGIVAGIWLAARFGPQVGAWLRLDASAASAGGFVVVLIAALLVVGLVGRGLRRLFRFAGFGWADTLLGIAVSVLKYLLVLSALFSAFDHLNRDYDLVKRQTIEASKGYQPVLRLSRSALSFLKRVGEQVPARGERPADEEKTMHDE